MSFDGELYKKVVRDTTEALLLENTSVWVEANTKLKQFLEDNTDIDDTKKAELFSGFLTETTKGAIQQILQNAKDIALEHALKRQQVLSMIAGDERESAKNQAVIANINSEIQVRNDQSAKDLEVKEQQITSMIAQDSAKNAEVAAKVAEAKYKIEHLYPAQTDLARKDIDLRSAEIAMRSEQTAVERVKAKLLKEQVDAEKAKVEAIKEEISLKKEMQKIEADRLELQKKEVEDKAKMYEADAKLKHQQADAVMASLATNFTIEEMKVQGQKEVAYIYATGGAR